MSRDSPSDLRVVIAGAGIAGLTASLSLHAAGITQVTVHEAVAEIRPLGVGINILPHAVRELIELGLGESLAAIGVPTADLTFLTPRGQRIWWEPRGPAAGYSWPQYSIHRGRHQLMLLEAVRERLGPGAVVLGSPVTDLRHDADLLIGADGIRSGVRRALFPGEGEPRPGGDVLWRGTTYARPFMTGRSMIMLGDGAQKLVVYPIAPPADDGTQLINWAVQHAARVEGMPLGDWNRPVGVEKVLPHVAGWHCDELDVSALVAGAEQVFEYPLVDRDPLPRWSPARFQRRRGRPSAGRARGDRAAVQETGRFRARHAQRAPELVRTEAGVHGRRWSTVTDCRGSRRPAERPTHAGPSFTIPQEP